MKQSSTTLMGAQKNILAIVQHFVSTNIKVAKTTVEAKLVNGVLPAGTLIAKDGSVAVTTAEGTTAYGVLLNDVDFNNSNGTEILPVVIHGFVKESEVKFDTINSAVEKTALTQITFM